MKITHLDPPTLYKNPAFSQAVMVEGSARLLFIGGQNGVNMRGEMRGNDLASQTEQAMRNVLSVLEAAGASVEQVVKLTIYVVQGNPLEQAYVAAQKIWGDHPTAISVAIVVGLAHPDAVVEIEAVAALEPAA